MSANICDQRFCFQTSNCICFRCFGPIDVMFVFEINNHWGDLADVSTKTNSLTGTTNPSMSAWKHNLQSEGLASPHTV